MSASRVSNKQILESIAAQTSAINALVSAISGNVTPRTEPVAATPKAVETDTAKPADVKVPASYLEHQKVKAQEHANNKGERVILYGRVNLAGEQKLAYCLASRWTSLRDNGLIGAIDSFDPK